MRKVVFAFVLAGLLSTAPAFAEICASKVSNMSVTPTTPLFSGIAIWLQWLNNGVYSCTWVSGSHISCTKSGVTYHIYSDGCSGSTCYAHTTNPDGSYRNGVSWVQDGYGQAANFVYDGWATGHLTATQQCSIYWPVSGSCWINYGSCFSN